MSFISLPPFIVRNIVPGHENFQLVRTHGPPVGRNPDLLVLRYKLASIDVLPLVRLTCGLVSRPLFSAVKRFWAAYADAVVGGPSFAATSSATPLHFVE